MGRAARVLIIIVITVYAGLIVLAGLSDRIIFQPRACSYSDTNLTDVVAQLGGGQVVHIRSGDQHITAIHLPNIAAKYTLLFSHGNAEDIGDDLPILEMYRETGLSVFAYDYRGYGTSTGHPSEKGVYEDELAAYRYLTENLRVPPERVISMGRSVGCAPAIHLAAHQKVAGLIAESPFMTAFRVLTRVPLLPWDKFNNLREIRDVHVPVLIIHGRSDQVIPFWHGERLFARANEPKQFVAVNGAGHNDVSLVAGKQYFEFIRRFTTKLD
jgi:fermentation-respiration switch protein FrsA (DUF1100 family)